MENREDISRIFTGVGGMTDRDRLELADSLIAMWCAPNPLPQEQQGK
jgi:hypothetical protein